MRTLLLIIAIELAVIISMLRQAGVAAEKEIQTVSAGGVPVKVSIGGIFGQ